MEEIETKVMLAMVLDICGLAKCRIEREREKLRGTSFVSTLQ